MNLPHIHIDDYNYELPDNRIAKFPLEKRDESKLLVYKSDKINHYQFKELPSILPSNSLLILNNTKVIHARLHFKKKTGAKIELFLLEPAFSIDPQISLQDKGKSTWICMIGNKSKWKNKEELRLGNENITAKLIDIDKNIVEFNYNSNTYFQSIIDNFGELPIPPYLNRTTQDSDEIQYQTVYSLNDGSVAAPTAGLHFTPNTFEELKNKKIKTEFITLHVGAGTFKPISTNNAIEHEMHAEKIIFSRISIENLYKHQGNKIAVGTTSLRSLESLYWFGIGLKHHLLDDFNIPQYFPYEHIDKKIPFQLSIKFVLDYMEKNNLSHLRGLSSIYILPDYEIQSIDAIITNFHQPKSTLLLLISSILKSNWKKVYKEALNNEYRFLSFGDSSLLFLK